MDYLHDPHPSELEEVLSSARLAGAETTTDPLYREIRRHMNPVVVDIDTVAEVDTNQGQRRRSQHQPKPTSPNRREHRQRLATKNKGGGQPPYESRTATLVVV